MNAVLLDHPRVTTVELVIISKAVSTAHVSQDGMSLTVLQVGSKADLGLCLFMKKIFLWCTWILVQILRLDRLTCTGHRLSFIDPHLPWTRLECFLCESKYIEWFSHSDAMQCHTRCHLWCRCHCFTLKLATSPQMACKAIFDVANCRLQTTVTSHIT